MTPFRPLVLAALVAVAACSTDAATPTAPAAGGLALKNLSTPLPNLLAAGQVTEAQFAELKQQGVTRVVCLRPATEKETGWEEQKAKELGIAFTRLPIAGADDLTAANARKLADELQAAGDGKALVYCGSSNRVGALLALKAFHVDGKSKDEALAFGKSAGLKALEPKVVEKLQK